MGNMRQALTVFQSVMKELEDPAIIQIFDSQEALEKLHRNVRNQIIDCQTYLNEKDNSSHGVTKSGSNFSKKTVSS